ncbi:MAG: ribonuclease J, partial [Saccharofermentanaceae bacterium]|nr:ribonuclease J [Saccharofermentanaceae bacterium]
MVKTQNRNMSVPDTSDGAKYGNAVRLPSASLKTSDNSSNSGSTGKSGSSRRSSRSSSGNSKKKSSSNSAPKAPAKAAMSKPSKKSTLSGSTKGTKKSAFAEEMKGIKNSGSALEKKGAFASVPDDVLSQINDTFLKTVKDAEKAFASKKEKHKLKVIPLGGMQEIGKNMTLFEYGNDIIIVDVGVAFPEESMLGVDSVIQDYTYVLQNKDKVRGIFLTHGHEDHIGSLPYLMRELKCPLYGGKLTIELARHKLMEAGIGTRGIELVYCAAGDTIKAGSSFAVEFIRVNHSIADAFAFAIRTPIGNVIHTGDFKIDFTPINGDPIDLGRFAEYGRQGVLLMLAESTNVEIPGSSPSEKHVGESFQRIFQNTTGRIIIATFSSHVHRMQQIFTAAEMYGRKVALIGRSMLNTFSVANSLGYITMNPSTLIDINDINKYEPEEVVILTTGSQA